MSTHARLDTVMDELAARASEESRAGMARYGINVVNAFGVSVSELRRVARRLGTDHDLALAEALAAVDRRDPAARSARWVARDALRELRSDPVLRRLRAQKPVHPLDPVVT